MTENQADFLDALATSVADVSARLDRLDRAALDEKLGYPSARRGTFGTAGIAPGDGAFYDQAILAPNSVTSEALAPGAVDSAAIGTGTLTAANFAASVIPPRVVNSLPSLPSSGWPQGSLAFLVSDQKLYRNTNGSSWSAEVASSDVTGTFASSQITADWLTAGAIAAGAISADKIAAGTITANEIAAGSITGDRIEATADIEAYYFRAVYGLYITRTTPDGHGTYNSILYGARDTGYNILTTDDPFDCPHGLKVPYNIGAATDANSSNDAQMNGSLAIDGTNGARRVYYRAGGAWHYVAETAGFEVPSWETTCPVCAAPLLPGQDMIGRGDRVQPDGALHALYIHLGCAGRPMDQAISDDYHAIGNHADLDTDPTAKATHLSLLDRLLRRARKAQGLDEEPVPPAPPKPRTPNPHNR